MAECRSIPSSREWLLKQIASGLMDTANECIDILSDPEMLEDVGFNEFHNLVDPAELAGQLEMDDVFAGCTGRLTLHFLAGRLAPSLPQDFDQRS